MPAATGSSDADGAAQAPAPRRRRGRIVIGAIIAAAVLLYGTVVALYALGGQVTQVGASSVPPDDGAVVELRPQSVDAAGDRLGIVLDLGLGDRVDLGSGDRETSGRTVTVLVSAAAGSRTLEFPVDEVPSPVSVSLLTDGFIEQWPFDTHTVTTTFVAYQVVDGEIQVIPTTIVADGRVPGWSIDGRLLPDQRGIIGGQEVELPIVELTATRAGSTVAFGLVLLGLMVVMPVVVLVVAIAAYRGRRRVEPTFLGWIGAMLFATIPMRTFLPGSPPIGSWVDFLLVLWVFAALIVGLIVFVAAWMRWSVLPAPRVE